MSVRFDPRQVGDVFIIDAAGRITLGEGTSGLRDSITCLAEKEHARKIILNLEKVTYVDASGIGEFVAMFTHLSNRGGAFKLLKIPKNTEDRLILTKLYTIFEVFDDEAEAVRSFDW